MFWEKLILLFESNCFLLNVLNIFQDKIVPKSKIPFKVSDDYIWSDQYAYKQRTIYGRIMVANRFKEVEISNLSRKFNLNRNFLFYFQCFEAYNILDNNNNCKIIETKK